MIAGLLLAFAAQCPDGSPPPCARASSAPAIDQRRIAILPFRVTATDTLFGAGLAELVANQINGEELRAAHMGSVLRAWRRAGGSLGTPLDQAGSQRVAREVGAGRVVDGSVVGLGARLTISASVITVPAGTTRRVGPISGTVDSLESLIGRLTAGLLGAAGRAPVDPGVRLTDNPEAMRAYLEGMVHYRGSALPSAAGAFERALSLDTSFARAALMRYAVTTWTGEDPALWIRRTMALRHRLSPAENVFATAFMGESAEPRTPAQHLADRRRAVALYPESPEALFEMGDYLFHAGRAHGISDFAEGRSLLERSMALDTQSNVAWHLLELGLLSRDSALVRRMWPVYSRTTENGYRRALSGFTVAEWLGDSSMMRGVPTDTMNPDMAPFYLAMEGGLGAAATERLTARFISARSGARRGSFDRMKAISLINTGRPSALFAMRAEAPDAGFGRTLDLLMVLAALYEGGDSSGAHAAAGRMVAFSRDTTLFSSTLQCIGALWQHRLGQPASYDRDLLQRRRPACLAALDLLEALRTDTAIVRPARLLDSLLRHEIASGSSANWYQFENGILARAFEARGQRAAALAAIRLRPFGVSAVKVTEASDVRAEGRLSALMGDTASAVRAYRRYLDLRRDAEPSLIPQRDSVAAALAALERRR